jgi:hypothetical protein
VCWTAGIFGAVSKDAGMDEQLGPLQEVFVLRKAFYLSETKVDCARDLYGPMHKTCMQAYDLCLSFFFMEDGSNAYLQCSSGACQRQGDMLLCSDGYLTRTR